MSEQQLLILCDPDMNADECTIAKKAITDVCTWLLDQPRTMGVDSCMPMFSELTFRVGRDRFNKGLRRRSDGTGWQTFRFSTVLAIASTPLQYFYASYEDALATGAAYQLNQLFRCESYRDDDFRQLEHYRMQLKWLEQHSPALHKEVTRKIRADGVKRRNAARRDKKSQTASQLARSPRSTDSQSLVHPPMNPMQAPVQKPTAAPQPLTIDEITQRAIDQQRAFWDSVRDGMKQDSTQDDLKGVQR